MQLSIQYTLLYFEFIKYFLYFLFLPLTHSFTYTHTHTRAHTYSHIFSTRIIRTFFVSKILNILVIKIKYKSAITLCDYTDVLAGKLHRKHWSLLSFLLLFLFCFFSLFRVYEIIDIIAFPGSMPRPLSQLCTKSSPPVQERSLHRSGAVKPVFYICFCSIHKCNDTDRKQNLRLILSQD